MTIDLLEALLAAVAFVCFPFLIIAATSATLMFFDRVAQGLHHTGHRGRRP